MKKKCLRIAALALVAAGLLLGVVGCGGKATPEKLLTNMQKKVSEEKNFSVNMLMECMLSGEIQEGTTMDINMDINLDMDVVNDPEGVYGKGSVKLGFFGMNQIVDMEMYMVQEDGEYVMYAGANGGLLGEGNTETVWTKETLDKEDITAGYDVSSFKEFAEAFELAEDTEKVNEEECYVLSGKVSGDKLEGILDTSMAAMDNAGEMFDELDLDDVELPIKLYISKSSELPVQMTMDMADLMGKSMGEEAGVSCSKFDYTITYKGFGKVDEIVVPEEVKKAAGTADSDSDDDDDLAALFGDTENETSQESEPESKVETDGIPLAGVEQTGELGANWDSYSVQVNGKVLNLPCTYEEFMSLGFQMDTDEDFITADSIVEPADYEYGFVYAEPEADDYISVYFYNNSDQPKKVTECLVGGIEVDQYFTESSGMEIIFPGGIKIGSTPEELTAAYGESMEKNVDSYFDRFGWLDLDANNKYFNVTVDKETNLIYSINMCNID